MGKIYYKKVDVDNDKPIDVGGMPNQIAEEIRDFFTRGEKFKKYGFAHKRGFLFHGPPGTGKSTLLRLIEERFIENFKGVVFLWNGDQSLKNIIECFRTFEADRPLCIVVEDLDRVLMDCEHELLGVLDGQVALNNVVFLATTNFLEAIPERVKNRPSRIDRLVLVPPPPLEARFMYLLNLGLSQQEATDIAAVTGGMSMAHLKEVVVSHLCLEMPLKEILARLSTGALASDD